MKDLPYANFEICAIYMLPFEDNTELNPEDI